MQSLEELIVLHCSPTLALLKPSSMFTCPYEKYSELMQDIDKQNRCLNKKGIHLSVLAKHKSCLLILVYHDQLLEQHLYERKIASFLRNFGYAYTSVNEAIKILKGHMREQNFPHEIGVFLGYPLHDVISFIENNGKNYQEIGCWKVYHNIKEARHNFACFHQCMENFQMKLHNGVLLENLVTI